MTPTMVWDGPLKTPALIGDKFRLSRLFINLSRWKYTHKWAFEVKKQCLNNSQQLWERQENNFFDHQNAHNALVNFFKRVYFWFFF